MGVSVLTPFFVKGSGCTLLFATGALPVARLHKNNSPGYPKMDFCPNFSACAWTRIATGAMIFTRLRCKQWDCEYCARKNQNIWRAFLRDRLPEVSNNWWLLTVTAASFTREQGKSYANLQHGIDKLMKRVRRVFTEFDYVRVYEKHPTSEALHAHFIISGMSAYLLRQTARNGVEYFRPTHSRTRRKGVWSINSWYKAQAWQCGMGYMVDCQKVETERARYYVTKYLTKDMQGINVKGMRHVQTTRGIGSPGIEGEYRWTVAQFMTARDLKIGEAFTDLNTGEQIEYQWWSQFPSYPDLSNDGK